MTIKSILAAIVIAATSAPAKADVLWDEASARAGFESLPLAVRKDTQSTMQQAGTYGSTVDGQWGPGTAKGVLETAKLLEFNSYDQLDFNLNTRAAAERFYAFITSDKAAGYLWGEGGECDGC